MLFVSFLLFFLLFFFFNTISPQYYPTVPTFRLQHGPPDRVCPCLFFFFKLKSIRIYRLKLFSITTQMLNIAYRRFRFFKRFLSIYKTDCEPLFLKLTYIIRRIRYRIFSFIFFPFCDHNSC